MPVLVALSRMYRGEHHPTDIAGSLIFSGLWLTAAVLLIKPNQDRPDGSAGRKAATENRGAAGRPADTAGRPEGRISQARTAAARALRAERTP